MEHLAATFEAAAAAFPQRPAVCMPDGTSLSYAELDARADRLAGFLQAAGVVPGDRVGLTVPKGFEAVTTVIAALKCGAAYVPSDWTAPDARGRAIMSDCAVKALVLHRQCLGVLDEWADRPSTVLVRWNACVNSMSPRRMLTLLPHFALNVAACRRMSDSSNTSS